MYIFTAPYEQPWYWMQLLRGQLARIRHSQPALPNWQTQQIDRAFHQAYRRFARNYSSWVRRGFDEDFLRQRVTTPLKRRPGVTGLPTGMALALTWDRHFGVLAGEADRAQQLAELTAVASHFLHLLAQALQPPDQETNRKSHFALDQEVI